MNHVAEFMISQECLDKLLRALSSNVVLTKRTHTLVIPKWSELDKI